MGTSSARPRYDLGYFDLIELDTNCASAQTGMPVKTALIENGPQSKTAQIFG